MKTAIQIRRRIIQQLEQDMIRLQGEERVKAAIHLRLLREKLKRDKAQFSLKMKIRIAKTTRG